MSNKLELTMKYISALSPVAIATDKNIGEHVVNKFMAMYQVPKEKAVAFWEREKDNFMKRISDSEDLKACTPFSIFMSLMQGFGWGLSFEGGEQMEIYLIMGNRKVSVNGADSYTKECVAQPSPYGKKKIRIQNGQIKDAGKPIVVFDNDIYKEYTDERGKLKVEYVKNGLGPRTPDSIVTNGFITIEKPDGSIDTMTFDTDDIASWRNSSAKKNSKWVNGVKQPGKANALYSANNGHIDKLFFEGKILTHAFKGYPKVISVPKLPETFVPDEKVGIRQGLDVSEFTEDTSFSEVENNRLNANNNTDEFDQALNEQSDEKVLVIAGNENDPEF